MMTVFVAGGSGTIGRPLVRALLAAGHRVVATARSAERQEQLARLGATPVVVDALDAAALEKAVVAARPSHIVHQLTALPPSGPRSEADLEATNRIREIGTRHLLRAVETSGARRVIIGSFAPGAALLDSPHPGLRRAAEAVHSMEQQTVGLVSRGSIEGVILRYGLFYGAESPSTIEMIRLVRRRRLPAVRKDPGRLPFIHLDDAVAATVAALDHGSSGKSYDIVDDHAVSFSEMVREMASLTGSPRPFAIPIWVLRLAQPYLARTLTINLALSNAEARRDLGWAPRFSSYREGLRDLLAHT